MLRTLNLKRRPRATKFLGPHPWFDHHPQPRTGLVVFGVIFALGRTVSEILTGGTFVLTMENSIGQRWTVSLPIPLPDFKDHCKF